MIRSVGLAMMAMAAVLAAPALADMPQGCSSAESGHGCGHGVGWMLLVDDLTKENFQNMTIREIEALKEQKCLELLNMTPAQIEEKRQQKMKEMENMTLAGLKESMPRAGGRERPCGLMGERMRPGFCWGDERGKGPGPYMAHPFLLMENLTEEELNNMTLAELKELRQKRMEELNNMTLGEIEELWKQKRDYLCHLASHAWTTWRD